MSERDEHLESALDRVPRPAARPEFKERLRATFLEDAAPSESPAPLPRLERARRFPIVWPFVLAASVACIVFFVLSRDRELRWRVLDAGESGTVLVDGVRVDVKESERLQDLLQTVQDLETKDATLRLLLRDELVIELGPDSHVGQMQFPVGGLYSMRVDTGSARVCTGPDFRGNKLRVLSRDLEVGCVGTLFAVDVEPKGSCLCCLEGTVDCDTRDGRGKLPCAAGKMCFAPQDRTPAMWSDAKAMHLQPLQVLLTWSVGHWKR